MALPTHVKRWFFRNFSTPRQVTRRDLNWFLDPRDKLQNLLLADQVHEAGRIERSCKIIKDMNIGHCLDIGANFGLYSIFWASRNSQTQIYAFEPIQKTYEHLTKNVSMNSFSSRIQTFNFALGADKSHLKVKFNPQKTGGTSLLRSKGNPRNLQEQVVAIQRLDDVLSLKGQSTFIKIDVEGYTSHVLKGANAFLLGNRCFVQVEIFDQDREAVHNQFSDLGYRLIGNDANDFYYTNFATIPPLANLPDAKPVGRPAAEPRFHGEKR